MGGWKDGWVDGWMGWVGGWMDGMGGWVGGWMGQRNEEGKVTALVLLHYGL